MYEALSLYLHQIQSDILYVDVKCVDMYEKLLNINLIYIFIQHIQYIQVTINFHSNMKTAQ